MTPHVGPWVTTNYVAEGTRAGHHWRYAACEWLTHCDAAAGALVGSACSTVRFGQTLRGFCFESSRGSLECGRLIDGDDPYWSKPQANVFGPSYGGGPFRCPRGAPSFTLRHDKVWTKRLLVGGCMFSADARYDALAEVHVPAACAAPRDWLQGCMFPDAENFDAAAKQPGKCIYRTRGCTDSSAFNYNSEATVPDQASCILPVRGCTLFTEGYANVSATTPMYQGLYVGMPLRGLEGPGVLYPAYGAVLKHDADANYIGSGDCTPVVEGCMNSSAANFDPRATANTNSWCLAPIEGCLVPATGAAAASYAANVTRKHTRDGLAINFDAAATKHRKKLCEFEHRGCTNPTAVNFNSHATVDDGSCYAAQVGCLNPAALNYGCIEAQVLPCIFQKPPVTIHVAHRCNYHPVSPPPPHPPPYGPGTSVSSMHSSETEVTMATSEVDAVCAAAESTADVLNREMAIAAGIETPVRVGPVDCNSGSAVLIFTQAFSSTGARDSFAAAAADPANRAAYSAAVGYPVSGVTWEDTGLIAFGFSPPSPPPGEFNWQARVIGGSIGLSIVLLCVGAFVYFRYKSKKMRAASVEPAYNESSGTARGALRYGADSEDAAPPPLKPLGERASLEAAR